MKDFVIIGVLFFGCIGLAYIGAKGIAYILTHEKRDQR